MANGLSHSVKLFCNLAFLCSYFGLFSCDKIDTSRCPTNLPRNRYLRVHGDKCYRFITNEVSWPSARDHCRRTGGELITIRHRDTQIFVERTLHEIWNRNGLWIGAHDRDSEMDWFWTTGEKVRSGFQNWDSGQPSCFLPDFLCHEDCACLRIDEGYKWHDYLCSSSMYKYGFACQYNLLPLPKTTTPTSTTITSTTTTTATTTTTTSTAKPSTTFLPTKATTRIETTSKEKQTTRKTTERTITSPEASTKANISVWTAPGNILNVQSQRLSKEESSFETGGMVGLIVSFVLVFIAGLVIGLFVCKRRYRKRYEESLNLGFNNVTYIAAPTHDAHARIKDINITSTADDCAMDEEVDHKYVDIDEIATGGQYVDLPTCKDKYSPVGVACLKDNIYDSVTTHEEAGPGKDMGACGVDAPPPCAGRKLEQFAPEFLKKGTDVSQAYSNNLYGYHK